MNSTAHIVIPGIHHDPSSPDGWTDRAVEWTHDHWPDCAGEKAEYFASFLFRRLGQDKRAASLASLLSKRANRRVVLTAHSNGADIICRAFKMGGRADVLNLVAPACERDFWKNGLNAALAAGRVRKVNVWISGKDAPMKLAKASKRLLGWVGLGYGTLGIDGPARDEAPGRVMVHRKPDWGHGSYWAEEHFDAFMAELMAASL